MRLTLECPHGEYVEGLKINCDKTGGRCAHQYYRKCKGWWVLSDAAGRCPLREEARQNERRETGPGDGNSI